MLCKCGGALHSRVEGSETKHGRLSYLLFGNKGESEMRNRFVCLFGGGWYSKKIWELNFPTINSVAGFEGGS